jgi:hypothetical protein
MALPPGLPQGFYELENQVRELLEPTKPSKLVAVTSANLPPAADHPDGFVRVSDLNIIAASDGSNWIRQDTGAAI